MSHNSDMIKMLRLVEGQQFAGEPGQQAGDQVRGIEKAAKNGQQHPFHSRLVGEEISLEDKLSKKYQDMKDLHGKEVAEVSDNALKSYQQKVSSDSMKHKADPTKRSPEKANRSVAGFAKAQNRLEQGVAEGLNEFAPPERGDGQENRFNFIEEFESDDGKYVIELYRNVESRSFAVSFHRDNMQYVMYPIDGIDAGDLADGADRYVKEIKKNAAHGSQEDFVALGSTDLEVFIPPEQGVAEGFNGEYDDEAGMAQSNLITTARAVMGLLKTIKDRDNLPEWGQEKIAKAEMMLVSVWDYLQSQKAMGNDPQQDMAEGERTMSRAAKGYEKYGKKGMQALAKAGRDDASDEKLNTIRNKHNKYDEGEDPYFESLRARVEELAKK